MFPIIEKSKLEYGFSVFHTCIFHGSEVNVFHLLDEALDLCIGKGRCKKCFRAKIHNCTHKIFTCRCSFHSFLFALEDNIDNEQGIRKSFELFSNVVDDDYIVQFLERLDSCSHIKDIGTKFIIGVDS